MAVLVQSPDCWAQVRHVLRSLDATLGGVTIRHGALCRAGLRRGARVLFRRRVLGLTHTLRDSELKSPSGAYPEDRLGCSTSALVIRTGQLHHRSKREWQVLCTLHSTVLHILCLHRAVLRCTAALDLLGHYGVGCSAVL